MAIIPLKRRFIVWNDQNGSDPEAMSYMLASSDALDWDDLLVKHRVVVLAEAGSGKSTEMNEQARLSLAAGRYTFLATVQNIGNRGLSSALGQVESLKLEEWLASDQPAWFFFDSVDEAKANDVRLVDVLKEIADGIGKAASRAHIVLSGRHTDWEFRRDLEHLEKLLAMPPADRVASPIDPNELVISVLRRDKPPEPPPAAEAPLVVVMGALSRSQVETFARSKGVTDVDAFFGALEKGNLWDFARRPLDLDWLVSYWRANGDLGRLTDMLQLSLKERLKETDPQKVRKDPLNPDRCIEALERIGAALVLQGLGDIAVPDSSLDLTGRKPALDLAEILPDWSGEDRTRLISRAVFDPASAGFARLHNDNQGVVRSFLTARWLKRLTTANCPRPVVVDLLFATTYGVSLVIPSMRQTAAWLSLWDANVAREVISRDPRLLMDAGDPSSLSLAIREQALKAIVEQAAGSEDFDIPDRDSLKRFALPDMAPCIRGLWTSHSGSPAVRELLLLMIWLGELTGCTDLAVAASFGAHTDRYSQVFSGRALMATGSESDKRRYAEYIQGHSRSVPRALVWDAFDKLFPAILSVDEFLLILKSVDVNDKRDSLGLEYGGPKLVDRLDIPQIERLLTGLLEGLATPFNPADERGLPKKDEPFLSTIEAAGRRLLELVPPIDAPTHAIDAALRLGEDRRYSGHHYKDGGSDLFSLLQATPERRRVALWWAVKRHAEARRLEGKPITDIWQIEFLGFSLGLKPEDVEWLLADAENRETPNERQIATNAALRLWRQSGSQPDLLTRIKAIGSMHTEVAHEINNWNQPQSPSQEDRATERELRRNERRNAVQFAVHDQSWRDFADRLRADPEQLRAIKPPTAKGVDARLFHLWKLLDAVGSNQSRYAINDLSPLQPMLGAAVVSALRDAFIAFWRHWSPNLRSERPTDQQNTIIYLDCIGIVGVTLEAASHPTWAARLSYDEAIHAAIYATLEFNGFPSWFVHLAEAQPDAVRAVLSRTIAPELKASGETDRCKVLEDISHVDVQISSLLADQLFEHLSRDEDVPTQVLGPILRILRVGYKKTGALVALLHERFEHASSVEQGSSYLVPLFVLDPTQAIAALDAKLAILPVESQTTLVQQILPKLFGDRWGDSSYRPSAMPFEILERLVHIAFRTVRLEDDNDHSDGEAYSRDGRDEAESARGALFNALMETPGLATFDAIHRLMEKSDFPISQKRMQSFARERAGNDSELGPWTSADVYAFESDFLVVPRNPLDLQRLVLRRLSDLQYDLLNADYAQGATVARLPAEVDVQNWMADNFSKVQGRSYSIEREPHVAEEKEPDIRFWAKASDANVPLEIKIAESWTLTQLEDALRSQLIGRYLRDRHNRWGILLLVHQKVRPRGWPTAGGDWFTFDQVVTHLRGLARSIAAVGPNTPQAEIAVIDVSTVVTQKKKRQQKKAELKGNTTAAKTKKKSKKLGIS